ncbi:uroporphyrinogen-III C-methyltransferase [Sanguibacter inulinus]|uniref:uroporphyrinogen-III C-methyltransferase n=1 Tax=Sanguibacter inulinus TaxID=60922 RepID=A0A853ESG4_9MICO|nr:uroporphyrinogen-III C-methyltransferase [Sanguibacter inulinus]MBF0721527.1 uroporphyrinogen-III C-methyltransferase [Sanguibacter inulinus]NYS92672.1 uroporphyrinogen-III C-methyltransferase [Sanguibacter inulinus]
MTGPALPSSVPGPADEASAASAPVPPTMLGLDLRGRRVLVAGGGPVATRRVAAMLDGGADVLVVAPETGDELRTLSATGRVSLAERTVEPADVDGCWLVHACTGDAAADAMLAARADADRVFCVVSSDVSVGSARTPATAAVAGMVLAVTSTGTADPRRVVAVRDSLVALVRGGQVDVGAARRGAAGRRGVAGLPGGPGGALSTEGLDGWAAAAAGVPDPAAAAATVVTSTSGAAPTAEPYTSLLGGPVLRPGTVALVGGGTGDPDLMTVRARTLLAQADVVVADRLGPTAVLTELADHVEVVHVGKSPGIHQVPQQGINQILVDRAQAGLRVVRLKGGDAFLFGRGGEEVLACRAAGVPVQVVPGITSAVAAAEVAGIPVTHRGTADRVHVVNGHGRLTDLDLAALATPGVTVVMLMGLAGIERIVAEALAGGAAPSRPAAVVVRATLPGEQVVRAPLAELASACHTAGLTSTGVIVVGEVAREGFLDPAAPGRAAEAPPSRKQLREAAAAAARA